MLEVENDRKFLPLVEQPRVWLDHSGQTVGDLGDSRDRDAVAAVQVGYPWPHDRISSVRLKPEFEPGFARFAEHSCCQPLVDNSASVPMAEDQA